RARPEEEELALLLRLQADEEHRPGALETVVRDTAGVRGRPDDVPQEEVALLVGVRPGAVVDVLRPEAVACEGRVGVGVLDAHAAADEHTVLLGPAQSVRGRREGLLPRGDTEVSSNTSDHRELEAVTEARVGEGPPALVAVPLLVDLRVVAGHPAQHGAATVVAAQGAPVGTVLADVRRRDEVEGTGPETVGSAGERPDRADLDGVAREVGLEGLLLVDAHL